MAKCEGTLSKTNLHQETLMEKTPPRKIRAVRSHCSDIHVQGSVHTLRPRTTSLRRCRAPQVFRTPRPTPRCKRLSKRPADTAPILHSSLACSCMVAAGDSLGASSAIVAAQASHPAVCRVGREGLAERTCVRCRPDHRLHPHTSSQ